ncbi:N-acetylmuramoyl-L-alanine amidase-like domain-containing protein [Parabacteroides johnsonii]|uniref:N-acetylmuramoyl-L-alanine amidase-like domain-containing protein n=1 Tax=Parabacteroides johnsonii TaxID=387661 RepID=UPI003AB3D59C
MKRTLFCLLFLAFLSLSGKAREEKVIYERYCEAVKEKATFPTGDLMVETARFFLGTPYVAGTLEEEPESLIINLHGLDCMTLVENTVALAWSVRQRPGYEGYASVLKNMRYRDSGNVTLDYTDRLHYTTDWMYENEKRGYLKDVTKEIGGQPLKLDLSFMSTHPDSYKQLKGKPERIAIIAAKEKEINARPHYYIPQDEINAHAGQIKNGDIVCFVTTVKGLDISHVGIICREGDKLTFIHASTTKKRVIVNEEPLQEYVQGIKRNCGIMIVRPQF